jgi:GGDEF domain-containing protein
MFARVLQDNVCARDTVARYGGEEFAVLLPGCSLRDARAVLERLRAAAPDGSALRSWRPVRLRRTCSRAPTPHCTRPGAPVATACAPPDIAPDPM